MRRYPRLGLQHNILEDVIQSVTDGMFFCGVQSNTLRQSTWIHIYYLFAV